MTSAQHRSVVSPPAAPTIERDLKGRDLKGTAPQGMWWVAWRQHRLQIAVLLGVMAALAAALVIFRARLVSAFTAAGCDLAAAQCSGPDGNDIWYNNSFRTYSPLLHLAMMVAPIALGVFAGAPIFTREFSHGTHVLALTQSVGRMRWWTAKIVVTAVPLVAGLLVLGFLMEWADNAVGYTAHRALNPDNFAVRSIIPAAFGLVFFAIGIATGIVTRSTVGALVAGLVVSIAAFAALVIVQPLVLPADRQVTQYAVQAQNSDESVSLQRDKDILWRGGGYLDASGNVLELSMFDCYSTATKAADTATGVAAESGGGWSTSPDREAIAIPPAGLEDSSEYQNAFTKALATCAQSKGIAASYQDYLPGSMVWPLRWTMAGICAALAALFLGLGAWRLRWAVANR